MAGRPVLNVHILSLLLSTFLGFAYLEYIFLDVFVLFFPVLICVIFLSVLGLVVSPAESSSLPPKRCALFGAYLWQWKSFCTLR